MKSSLAILLAATLTATACSNLERSRSLANPDTSAKTIALQVCSNCHGVEGNSVSPNFPNLAGQQRNYVISQVQLFRNHNRHDPSGFEYMWGISRNLTDKQIEDLAAYFSAQRPKRGAGGDPALLAEGKRIFDEGVPDKNIMACTTCHGEKAQGNDSFPRLAYQHADYIIKQLTVFQRTDDRPEGSIMKTIAHDMTERNMEAVAAYLQAFPD